MKGWHAALTAFGIWILSSLLSIAYVGSHPLLSLGIAVTGGVALGIFSSRNSRAS
ncbi:MAG: hypothetical protein J7M34_11105 [Anaerolineae bacterium]|nr:hypothetical protein [Anaerolineae bacterium]